MNKIKVILGDITSLTCDAIVNAANSSLLGGGGVDGAIHKAAGSELLKECQTLRGCKTGFSKITKGYNLKVKHIIHTVGPIYQNGLNGEKILLASCYKESLKLCIENNIKSVAFSCISTGIYGFPYIEAAKIAINEVKLFLVENDYIEEVIFCCFLQRDFDLYNSLLVE